VQRILKSSAIVVLLAGLAACGPLSQTMDVCDRIKVPEGQILSVSTGSALSYAAGASFDEVKCRARYGDKNAQFALGAIFEAGEYQLIQARPGGETLSATQKIEPDLARAVRWYKMSAAFISGKNSIWVPEAGNVPGHVMSVNSGPDVPGNSSAMYRLGVIYAEQHKGKEKTAIKWLKRAVKAGHREARVMLAALEKAEKGTGKVSDN